MTDTPVPSQPGAAEKTQAFSLVRPDATIHNIDLSDKGGLAELIIARGPQAG